MAKTPGGKKALFAGLLVLAAWLAVEAAAWLLLWGATGQAPWGGRRRAERLSARSAAAALANPVGTEAAAADEARAPVFTGEEVLHPYLGFVRDPEGPHAEWRRITPEGFLTVPIEPPGSREELFTVAVFGGSVANQLAFLGRRQLVTELARAPRVAGRRVWVESYAMGGYKQPQQLMALAYRLALGEIPDLVINLDGFNEVALPLVENLRDGVHPSYPRAWPVRVRGLPDPEAQRRVGEIAYLEALRVRRSRLCEGAVTRHSPACHLVWRSLDRRLASRTAVLRDALAGRRGEKPALLTQGPPYARPARRRVVFRQLAELWARSSLEMNALCGAWGIPYFHFLQPNQYVPGAKPIGRAERHQAIDPDHPYARAVPGGYAALRQRGAELVERGVAFHDLTGLFADNDELLYSDTCCHLNRRGNALLAAEIGRRVREAMAATAAPARQAAEPAPVVPAPG